MTRPGIEPRSPGIYIVLLNCEGIAGKIIYDFYLSFWLGLRVMFKKWMQTKTPVSRAIGEHSNHYANIRYQVYIVLLNCEGIAVKIIYDFYLSFRLGLRVMFKKWMQTKTASKTTRTKSMDWFESNIQGKIIIISYYWLKWQMLFFFLLFLFIHILLISKCTNLLAFRDPIPELTRFTKNWPQSKFKSHSRSRTSMFKLSHQLNDVNRDPIYPTPPLGQDMTQGQFFKRSLTGLNSEFSFS